MRERYKRTRWVAPVLATSIGLAACSSAPQTYALPPDPGAPLGVSAAPNATPNGNGFDVSWPQCGQQLPIDRSFGIVGMNTGVANRINPCLSEEFTWARGSSGDRGVKTQLYLVGEDPGPSYRGTRIEDWPKSGRNIAGDCNGSNSKACSFQYGFERARATVKSTENILGITSLGTVWIDIESGTTGIWESNSPNDPTYATPKEQANNTAAIEGFAAGIGKDAGIYSTQYQFDQITGGVSSGRLANEPEWVAGAETMASCSTPFISGAEVTVVQFTRNSPALDIDRLCPA